MMFFKPASFIVSALAILTAANPIAQRTEPQCGNGSVYCCNSATTAKDPAATTILGLLGVVLQDLNVGVGLGCSPISVLGLGGVDCSKTTVYCSNNNYNGLIVIGCTPIIIDL